MSGEPWLILPTYNEAENIEAITLAAGEVLARAAPEGYRVLIVDDGSPDGTGEIADALAAEHDWVKVLHRTEKNGIGPAYLAGFRHALERGAGYVMEMDSDFSHDPADLARLLAAVRERRRPGARLALRAGRRRPRLGPAAAAASARAARPMRAWCSACACATSPGGFKCFRREVLEAIDFDGVRSQGYAFQVELTYRAVQAGFRVSEVPIVFRDRQHGQSKMSWRIAAEAMWLVPRLRFR